MEKLKKKLHLDGTQSTNPRTVTMKNKMNKGTDPMKQTASKTNQKNKQMRTEGKPTTEKENEEREIGKTRSQ